MDINYLEVILKTTSRCNINCSYCYYFHGADEEWKTRTKRISSSTLTTLAYFLKDAVIKHNIPSIQIDFHGGEPLLQRKKAFREACQTFIEYLSPIVKLEFALQTNALLIDEEWIDIFEHYGVRVSVSLDGPKTINDRFRVDHKGKGTFERAVKGIQLLGNAVDAKKLKNVALLCVINPWGSGKQVYRYFVDTLKINTMDFLLPTKTHEPVKAWEVAKIGNYLLDVWDAWVEDDNPDIKIRFFNALFAALGGHKAFIFPSNDFSNRKNYAITIDTDGAIYGDDSLRSNLSWKNYPRLHLENTTFDEYLGNERRWYAEHIKTPDICRSCLWEKVCQGGQLEHRYVEPHGYNHPSVYCDALKRLYSEVIGYLVHHGLDQDHLQKVLVA